MLTIHTAQPVLALLGTAWGVIGVLAGVTPSWTIVAAGGVIAGCGVLCSCRR